MTLDVARFPREGDRIGAPDRGEGRAEQISGVRRLVIEQFVKHQQYRGLSRKTIERRRSTLSQLAEFLHPLPLERATRDHLEAFIGSKQTARTKHAYRSDLRVFYAWALSHELTGTS